eukprot:11266660-Ditylum_brightwellii.AAC.1
MSLGEGSILSWSMKQCLNTKSSTENKLIGIDDAMPHVLWTPYLLWGQGYEVNCVKIYQDNLSAMLLEKNGKWSSTKRTKHINVHYFFVKDRIANRDIEIDHCGMEYMVAGFFTKPLQ